MTTYAIGSVKGYYQPLLKLLEIIQFDPENDCLWFTGNLVNEGPVSLAVLRFVKDMGKKAVTVLGNQELHLLALAEGFDQPETNGVRNSLKSSKNYRNRNCEGAVQSTNSQI
jgi:bis(5'-nucleosyl)-tetraphosphatase (symmetrical)